MSSDYRNDDQKTAFIPAGIPIALRRLSAATAAVLILSLFYVGSRPLAVGMFAEPWDKLAHLSAFFAIAALLWTATDGRRPLAIYCAVLLVAGLDEWHQIYLPGRQADVDDFLIDAIGAGTAVFLLYARRGRGRPDAAPVV